MSEEALTNFARNVRSSYDAPACQPAESCPQPCRCRSAEVVGTRELVAMGGTQSPPRRALLTASSNLVEVNVNE